MQKCAYPQYIGSQYFWQFSRPKSFPTSTKNRRDVFTLSFSEKNFLETIFFLGCIICRLWPSHSDDHKKTSLKIAKAFFSLSLSLSLYYKLLSNSLFPWHSRCAVDFTSFWNFEKIWNFKQGESSSKYFCVKKK